MNDIALISLNEKQKNICLDNGNLLITACPGSGKTRTLTHKIAYYIENNTSIKKIVAITYTNRAADEILNRLNKMGIDCSRLWVGTIHQFCLDFILNRFKMYNLSISKSYSIIDERITEKYINDISNSLKISISNDHRPNLKFNRNLQLIENNENFLKIVRQYYLLLKENKEIDFDLILVHSFNILRKNPKISSVIKNSIELLCIDECQDTQDLQFAIIEEIYNSNLNIKMEVNFFGDPNQAIYTTLGGCVKNLVDLNNEFVDRSFKEIILDGCYRSSQDIINFYSGFMVSKYSIQSLSKSSSGEVYICNSISKDNLASFISETIDKYLQIGVNPNEICVVAPVWFFLFSITNELKKELPNIPFDAPEITPIKKDPLNLYYKISYILLTSPSTSRFLYRLKIAREIIEELSVYSDAKVAPIDLLNFANALKEIGENDIVILKSKIMSILKYFNIELETNLALKNQFENFFLKIEERLKKFKDLTCGIGDFKKMFDEKDGVVVNTIHGIKGEEYKVVICFGLQESKIPSQYTDASIRDNEANKLLYVLSSRAKNALILISEVGRKCRKGGLYFDDCCSSYLIKNCHVNCKKISSIDEISFNLK